MIEWCLTAFSTVFQLYHGGQCTYTCFPRVLLTSTPHNILSIFPSHRLLSHKTIVETTDSSERGMNPVTMPIITSHSLLKKIWEKKKLLIMSNFSFSQSDFCPFKKCPAIFINLKIVV